MKSITGPALLMAALAISIQAAEFHEEKLFRKSEIFLQKPIPYERLSWIRQDVLVFFKSHRMQAPTGQLARGDLGIFGVQPNVRVSVIVPASRRVLNEKDALRRRDDMEMRIPGILDHAAHPDL